MVRFWSLAAGFIVLAMAPAAHAADGISLELNKVEEAGQKCRTYLVMTEKMGRSLASLKTDLVIFGKDGTIAKRLVTELGPLRAKKTVVKVFDLDLACANVSALLVNDVVGCSPGVTPEQCLDELALSSKTNIRLFK